MTKYKYLVSWDSKHGRVQNEYDTIEDARLALQIHKDRDSVLTVTIIR
jgi:hypothetical protein